MCIGIGDIFEEYSEIILYKYTYGDKERKSLAKSTIYIVCDNCGKTTTKKYPTLKLQLVEHNNKTYCKRCLAGMTSLKNHGDWNYCNKDKILITKESNKNNPVTDNEDKILIEKYKVLIDSLDSPLILKEIASLLNYNVKSLIPKLRVYNIFHDKLMDNKFPTYCKVCGKIKSFKSDYCSRVCQYIDKNKREEFLSRLEKINPDIIPLDEYSLVTTRILCKCKICNKEWKVTPDNLLRGSGCPNCFSSKGEKQIEKYLIDSNILHKTQHTFEECKFKNKLKFDFYLPEHNICIEFDGEQHFKPIFYWGAIKALRVKLKEIK